MAYRDRRLVKFVVAGAAAVAVAVVLGIGALQLMMSRLPSQQAELQAWVTEELGLSFSFERLDARFGANGPEVTFDEASVATAAQAVPFLYARRAVVSLDPWKLSAGRRTDRQRCRHRRHARRDFADRGRRISFRGRAGRRKFRRGPDVRDTARSRAARARQPGAIRRRVARGIVAVRRGCGESDPGAGSGLQSMSAPGRTQLSPSASISRSMATSFSPARTRASGGSTETCSTSICRH